MRLRKSLCGKRVRCCIFLALDLFLRLGGRARRKAQSGEEPEGVPSAGVRGDGPCELTESPAVAGVSAQRPRQAHSSGALVRDAHVLRPRPLT